MSYELRLNALHRDNIGDLKNIYVCMLHFHTKDIITVDRVSHADGNFTETIRTRPRLCQTLYLPSHLVVLGIFLRNHYQDPLGLSVHNFQKLITVMFSLPLSNKWMVWCSGSNLRIFMPKLQGHLLSTE